jgi:hypothetical protein
MYTTPRPPQSGNTPHYPAPAAEPASLSGSGRPRHLHAVLEAAGLTSRAAPGCTGPRAVNCYVIIHTNL